MQVRLHDALVFLGSVILKSLANVRAGDIEQDVRVGAGGRGRVDGLVIRDVQPEGLGRQACLAQDPHFALQVVSRACGQDGVRSLSCGGPGNRQSNAPARARNQCSAPLKQEHACVVHMGCHVSSDQRRTD